jgi:hypothetical protein
MNGGYQPKINRDALLQGYVGADPRAVGMMRGYTQQQVDRSRIKPKQEEASACRPNPYIK